MKTIHPKEMIIKHHKKFKKQYLKLNVKLQKKVDTAIAKFIYNPFDPTLNNHALKGLLKNRRSIDATGDYRIQFKEYKSYTLVLMIEVGTHSQLY